jgi:hypothetical protein
MPSPRTGTLRLLILASACMRQGGLSSFGMGALLLPAVGCQPPP